MPEQAAKDDCLGQILACFPGEGPLAVADFELADQGLGIPKISQRAQYMVALKNLIKQWKEDLPQQIVHEPKPLEQYSELELLTLERMTAWFYCQSFFNYFGRVAVVPHSLSAPAS
jgi:hypothetical protein